MDRHKSDRRAQAWPEGETTDRRAFPRPEGDGRVLVIREIDPMCRALEGHLRDVSAGGIAIDVRTPIAVGEFVSIEVENPVQKVKVMLRGQVRRLEEVQGGWYQLGCSLVVRLGYQEIKRLRKLGEQGRTG